MNMQIDKYTGEAYDADVWYRGEGGCWVNRQAEAEWRKRAEEREAAKRRRVNERRVSLGKRKRSPSSFSRSAERYRKYLDADSDLSFGEWLKNNREPFSYLFPYERGETWA